MDEESRIALKEIVGTDYFCFDPDTIEKLTRNTLGIYRKVLGIVYPNTTEQVEAIIRIANRNGISLYPFSTAKNIGYGERLPVLEDNLIVDLGRMNEIVYIDPVLGYADLQPGVTQGQLCDYLAKNKLPFFMDTTGAGRDSSIVGNVLEGGFGITPKGFRRKEITRIKGVFGNGDLFDTGSFPGDLGPDLSGMFVQSNFAIITQMRVHLNPIVDEYQSFAIEVKDNSGLIPLIETVRELRQKGTITSQVTIMNALDLLFTTSVKIPIEYESKVLARSLTNEDAKAIISNPLAERGKIAAGGAIYGTKQEVKAKKKTINRLIKKNLNGAGKITYLSDRRLKTFTKLFGCWPLRGIDFTTQILQNLEFYSEIHGLIKGQSSDEPLKNLLGGVRETYDDTRLMWYSSRISSKSEDIERFVKTARACYNKYQFEYPLEMLLVTPNDIIAIQKVDWVKGNIEQENRAMELYQALATELGKSGFFPYRLGIQSQESIVYPEERRRTLDRLKRTFDPKGIISPGRYGIR